MMIDFMEGMKTALKHQQIDDSVQLVSESIGFGGNEKEVYEKVEKILVLDAADILVAYIDRGVIPILEPLLYTSGKLMIVVNTGANYPQNWVSQPNILHLTLQHGFLCWLTGMRAAKNGVSHASMATSFYDCGYLHTAAISNGFMSKGGQIRYNYVNNNLYDDSFEIKPLTNFLSSDKEIVKLLCVFDEKPATLFYKRLNKYEGASRLQLFVSPMMLQKKVWEEAGTRFHFSIEGYLPYHDTAANKINVEFNNIFKSQTKREPSIFALQGWEAATILGEIFHHCKEKYTNGTFIKDHLSITSINSPRGELRLDMATNYFRSPVNRAILNNNSGDLLITAAENNDEWETFVANPVEGPVSGWTNTYLCY